MMRMKIPKIKFNFVIISLLILTEISCISTNKKTSKIYPLLRSFNDTLEIIKTRFENKNIEKYIIFSSVYGNCFGPSITGRAKIFWFDNETYYCRAIIKNPQDKKPSDKITICNSKIKFDEFLEKRLDTVKTLPTGYWHITPPTMDKLIIKYRQYSYEKEFEHFPILTSKDSTHILFYYLKEIIKD